LVTMPPKKTPTPAIHPRPNISQFQSSLSSLPSPSQTSSSGSSSSPAPSASSPSSPFVAGHFPCPVCNKTFDSAPHLIQHVHKHIDGMLPGKPSLSAFADINYIACRFCHHFFRGVSQHERFCAKKLSQPPPDPDLMEDLPLPSLDEICSSYRPTLSFVPAAHRQAWARVLFLELDRVALDNSLEAWTRLFMLPKCVLIVPKRGGRRNRGDRFSISELCAFWEEGQLNWLWSRHSRKQPEPSSRSSDSKRAVACAIQHARCGRFGRACAALSTSGLAPDSHATLSKLESKHPQADAPQFALEPVLNVLQLSVH
jgi:hypothetical protein